MFDLFAIFLHYLFHWSGFTRSGFHLAPPQTSASLEAFAVKNLATFLAPQRGQKMKIGPQGTCKVSFFCHHLEQRRTKFSRSFSCLRQIFSNIAG
jgi:hypothetical protein